MGRVLLVTVAGAAALLACVTPATGDGGMLTISPPSDMTVTANALCRGTPCAVVSYAFTVSGGVPPYNVTCNLPSPGPFLVGSNRISCMASDSEDDSTPDASFTLTVLAGNIQPQPPPPPPPPLTISAPGNMTATAWSTCNGAPCAVVPYSFTVSGGTPPYDLVCNLPSPGPFLVGTYTISCMGQDSEDDSTPEASFTLTVTSLPASGGTTSGTSSGSTTIGSGSGGTTTTDSGGSTTTAPVSTTTTTTATTTTTTTTTTTATDTTATTTTTAASSGSSRGSGSSGSGSTATPTAAPTHSATPAAPPAPTSTTGTAPAASVPSAPTTAKALSTPSAASELAHSRISSPAVRATSTGRRELTFTLRLAAPAFVEGTLRTSAGAPILRFTAREAKGRSVVIRKLAHALARGTRLILRIELRTGGRVRTLTTRFAA